MMQKQEHTFTKNQRVKLKGDPSNLYQMAAAGSEGWVRKQAHDELGYPIVYIEWDKDHWTYNGEQDEWTLEAHFASAEEEDMNDDPREPANDALERLLQEAGKVAPKAKPKGALDGFMSIPWPSKEDLAKAVAKAADLAQDDEAFMLFSIHKDEEGNLIPTIASCLTTPESAILLEAQLARVGAIAHSDLATIMINLIMDERDKD